MPKADRLTPRDRQLEQIRTVQEREIASWLLLGKRPEIAVDINKRPAPRRTGGAKGATR